MSDQKTKKPKNQKTEASHGFFSFSVFPFFGAVAFAITLSVPIGAAAEEAAVKDKQDTASEATPEEAPATPPAKEKEKISLDLKGVDVVELFRILSLKTGLTIVPTKEVSGRINIYLNNQTFEDALDIILVSQDLAYERTGDILYIMSAGEYERLYGRKYNEKRKVKTLKLTYAQPATVFDALSQLKSDIGRIVVDKASGILILIDVPDKLELMEQAARQLDQSPQTEIFDLKYAKSKDLKEKLSSAITQGPGELVVDERSNRMVVSDLPEKMKRIERMVRAFDAEPPQVLIDAALVQLTLNDQFQRGVDWEKAFGSWLKSADLIGKFPVSPVLSSKQQITIGTVRENKFTTVLQYLQTYGDTKILSRPRIAAINGQEAKILVGAREAYVSQTLSQAQASTVTSESVQFIDVGVKLNVVPTINSDGFVVMKIKPEVSSVRETLTTSLGSRIPIVETSESETVIKVKDGVMVMIGGLMKEERRNDRNMTPGVGKIPILGALFSTRAAQSKRTELIIFLTPHIMTGEMAVAGTEPEHMIPPEVLPEDVRKAIISRIVSEKIQGIQVKAEEPPAPLVPSAPMRTQAAETSPGELQVRLKGMKEF